MIDPDLLLEGYRLGVFPMAMSDDSIEWFSPDPRAILPLEDFHVPHALRRLVRRKLFEVTIDKAFLAVIQACAERNNTWINREIILSKVEGSRSVTVRWFSGIPRLRSAPLGMTKTESKRY